MDYLQSIERVSIQKPYSHPFFNARSSVEANRAFVVLRMKFLQLLHPLLVIG